MMSSYLCKHKAYATYLGNLEEKNASILLFEVLRGLGGKQHFPLLPTYLCKNEGCVKLEANMAMLNGLNRGWATPIHP